MRRLLNKHVIRSLLLLGSAGFSCKPGLDCPQMNGSACADGQQALNDMRSEAARPVQTDGGSTSTLIISCSEASVDGGKKVPIACPQNSGLSGCTSNKAMELSCPRSVGRFIDPEQLASAYKKYNYETRWFRYWRDATCYKSTVCRLPDDSASLTIEAVFTPNGSPKQEYAKPVKALWGLRSDDYWIAGADGLLFRSIDGAAYPGVTKSILGVSGCRDGRIWAVGERGLILRYVATPAPGRWEKVPIDTNIEEKVKNENLLSIWADCDARRVWAGGTNGVLFSMGLDVPNMKLDQRPGTPHLYALWGGWYMNMSVLIAAGDHGQVQVYEDDKPVNLPDPVINELAGSDPSFRALAGSVGEAVNVWLADYKSNILYHLTWPREDINRAMVKKDASVAHVTSMALTSSSANQLWLLTQEGAIYTKDGNNGAPLQVSVTQSPSWVLMPDSLTSNKFSGLVAGESGVFRYVNE